MSRLAVRHHVIRRLRFAAPCRPLRIAHLSDIHFRRWTRALRGVPGCLQEAAPDLVVITGDYGDQGSCPQQVGAAILELLGAHRPPLGCFGVLGNHDGAAIGEVLSSRVRILSNEHVLLHHDGQPIALAGIEGRSMSTWDLPAALRDIDEGTCTVLLSHYPHAVYSLPPGRVDVLLAGDTHGGQIRLPWIGPLSPGFSGLEWRYAYGLNRHRGVHLHVSSGLGSARLMPLRLGCPREVTFLDITHGVSDKSATDEE